VSLIRMCTLLLLNAVSYTCQLDQADRWYCSGQLYPYSISICWFCQLLIGVTVSRIVDLSIFPCKFYSAIINSFCDVPPFCMWIWVSDFAIFLLSEEYLLTFLTRQVYCWQIPSVFVWENISLSLLENYIVYRILCS